MSEVTKRRVTMTNVIFAGKDEKGRDVYHRHEAVDYVRPDFLDAYVEDARTRWQSVEVSDEPDAGPLGFDGPTVIPEGINHPQAGTYFPPTSGSKVERDLIKAGDTFAAATEGSDDPVPLSDLQEG